ncbi:unnamed protein product [Calypogeia fissa]
MTKRGPVGQPEEGERRKRNRGPVGTIGKDSRSTISKALGDAIVQEHGSTSEDALDDMFLPGIFNDITMAHIVCWKDTLSLSSVNRTLLHRIRSCQVRCSTESFVVLLYYRRRVNAENLEIRGTISIALYSMKEDRCYELPPLPPFAALLPGTYWYTSVSLDCKVSAGTSEVYNPKDNTWSWDQALEISSKKWSGVGAGRQACEQSGFPRTTILRRSKSHLGGENREIVWQRARTDILDELGDMGESDVARYELVKLNHPKGLSAKLVRRFTTQAARFKNVVNSGLYPILVPRSLRQS